MGQYRPPSLSSVYFSIVSALAAEQVFLCRFRFLHLLLLCNISSFSCTALHSALHPSSSSTESSQTLLAPSSLVLCDLFFAVHLFPRAAFTSCVSSPDLCNPPLPRHFPPAHDLFVHLQRTYLTPRVLKTETDKFPQRIWFLGWVAVVVIVNIRQRHRAASFCIFRPMFVAACWQRCQVSDPPMSREMDEVNQSEHTVTP